MEDGFTTWAFTGTEHFYAENIYFHNLGMTGHKGNPASGYAGLFGSTTVSRSNFMTRERSRADGRPRN